MLSCMYVWCMYAHIYVCEYIMGARACVCFYVCMYACMYACIYTHACIYAGSDVCMYVIYVGN